MRECTTHDIDKRGIGLRAVRERWTRTLPPYLDPPVITRGRIITAFGTAPGVADILDDRTGQIVLARDVRLEREAAPDATE